MTGLYMMAAIALIALIGAGTYALVDRYFGTTTDLALHHRMAEQFQVLGAQLPAELAAAESEWYGSHGGDSMTGEVGARLSTPSPTSTGTSSGHEDREGGEDREESEGQSYEGGSPRAGNGEDEQEEESREDGQQERNADHAYQGELAAIFVIAVTAQGKVYTGTDSPSMESIDGKSYSPAPISVDREAVAVAMQQGRDLRTVSTDRGLRVRLLTYRLPETVQVPRIPEAASGTTATGTTAIAAMQLGRVLNDQERVLDQLLLGLVVLSSVSALLLGVASWWLAGRALRPAQQAWDRQQAFVANASHELRTPLTLMRAGTEVALRSVPPSDEVLRPLLQDVLGESDHMARLIEDLLLLSRLDAGKLPMNLESVPIQEMLHDVERHLSRPAAERGIDLVVAGARSEGGEIGRNAAVMADRTRLRQVLLILLDNALRHTPSGGSVRIEVRPSSDKQDGRAAGRSGRSARWAEIAVADTGSGIAPEDLPHVFERFYQAEAGRGASPAGSGLGLSIARALVEAQHGHISIQSRPGQGTRVTLLMPSMPPVED
jgi:signal transduction histidine kinase